MPTGNPAVKEKLHCLVTLNRLTIQVAKRSLAIFQQPVAKHVQANLETSYCLNRNYRVSSFYWTRGSKQSFLTCFSYFSCYFLILVFLQSL